LASTDLHECRQDAKSIRVRKTFLVCPEAEIQSNHLQKEQCYTKQLDWTTEANCCFRHMRI